MEKRTSIAVASSTGISAICREKTNELLSSKMGIAVAGAVIVNFISLSILFAIFGFDFVVVKIYEFVTHQLSKITTQGAFVTTVALGLLLEVFLVKNGKNSIQRLLKPSKSAQTDLFMYFFLITGINVLLYAVMTLGSSEMLPYLLNRMPEIDVFYFTDNVWVKFTLIYLVITFGEYWAHRLGHTWKWAWAGHKFHHAATEMTMINAYRNSPVGGLLPMILVSIPVAIMGPSGVAPLAFFGSLIIIHNMLNHSNVNWSYGWVGKYLIASPRYHRIHHSTHEDHINKNFCDRIVLWDRVFNTYYEGDVEPVEFGFEGNTDNQSNVLKDLIDGAVETYVELCKVVLRK